MEITIARHILQKALIAVSKAVSNKPTLEILRNIAIIAKDNTVRFSATDTEISISTVVGADVSKSGSVTVSAKTMIEFVNLVKSETIKLYLDNNELKVDAGNTKSKLPTIGFEEFPELPEINEKSKLWVKISVKDLVPIINKTTFAADRGGERQPVFSGIFIHTLNTNLIFVATDAFRLSRHELVPLEIKTNDYKAIVPYKTMDILAKLVEEEGLEDTDDSDNIVEFFLVSKDNQILFKFGNTELVSNLFDDNYPDYNAIIPDEKGNVYEFELEELINAVKLSRIFFVRNEAPRVRFEKSLKDTEMTIKSFSQDGGDSLTKLKLTVIKEDDSLDSEFSPNYLLEILSRISTSEVEINLVNHPRNNHKLMLLSEKGNDKFIHLLTSLSGVS